MLAGDPELVRKDLETPKPKTKGGKFSVSVTDLEVRANEFVRRSRDDPKWAGL